MTRIVEWSRAASDDIRQQLTYIAADNPAAAMTIARRIRETGSALGVRATGRPGRVQGTSEKLVVGLPYLIAYVVTVQDGAETVSILRIIHTARHWPADEWPD